MDKRLNLILNLTEGPDSRTTAEKVNDSLQEMYKTVDKIVQGSKREQEILKEQSAELQRQNELWRKRAELAKQGKSTSAIDAAGAQSVAKSRALGTELGNIRGQRAADKSQLQEQRRAWDNQTKAFEREEEKRAQSAIRAMKKQEKERDKFIRSAKGALDGLLSLAESAALAYASMMNIDESNVKKWLQWMGAIKSVGAGLKGIYDVYKSVHTVIKMLQAARVAETAATTAATLATKANTAAEVENCAAKSACGGGGGGGGVPAKGGMLSKMKGWGGKLLGGAGRLAAGYGGLFLGTAAAAYGAIEGISYLTTGKTFTGELIKDWSSSNKSASDLKFQQEAQVRVGNRKRGYDLELDLGTSERRRENRGYALDAREKLTSSYSESGEIRRRHPTGALAGQSLTEQNINRRIEEAARSEGELRSKGGTLASNATEERRAAGYKLIAEAEEQLIKKLELEVEKKKAAQETEMRAQEKQLKEAEKYYSASEEWLDKATKKADELRSKFDSMAGGLMGMSRGQAQRAIQAREKMSKGEDFTWKEAELARQAGLVNTPEMEAKYRDAQMRELERTGRSKPGDYVHRTHEEMKKAEGDEKKAKLEVSLALEDLVIEQAITVELKAEQEQQLDAMIDKIRPQLEEALKRRDEAIVEAFKNERWKAMIEEEVAKLRQELEANT